MSVRGVPSPNGKEAAALPPLRAHDRAPLRVSPVDSHEVIRRLLADIIEQEEGMQICGQAATAAEAFRVLEEERPHVAVVDISLEDAHGLELIQDLRVQYPEVQVVVFSMYDEAVYAERALRAGASGYVMKGTPPTHLMEAIRFVAEGGIYLSRRMTSVLLSKVARAGQLSSAFPIGELTGREMEVFQMLGEGKSVEEIAEQLNLSRKTVETYRRRAKEKLDLDSVTELQYFATQWVTASRHLATA